MHALILALASLLLLVQPEQMTVSDCLLKSGFSTIVQSHPHYTLLEGENTWTEADKDALRYGDSLGSEYVITDTGRRKTSLIAYAGSLYVFVYKHPDDPLAYERMPSGILAWHGDCMLRLD